MKIEKINTNDAKKPTFKGNGLLKIYDDVLDGTKKLEEDFVTTENQDYLIQRLVSGFDAFGGLISKNQSRDLHTLFELILGKEIPEVKSAYIQMTKDRFIYSETVQEKNKGILIDIKNMFHHE